MTSRYDLTLFVPATKDEPVRGRTVLQFSLSDATQPLVLDFEPDQPRPVQLKSNGVATSAQSINGHLVVPPSSLRRGENTLEIDFTAGDGPLNRGDDQAYYEERYRQRVVANLNRRAQQLGLQVVPIAPA
jgi:aminopeptidase N